MKGSGVLVNKESDDGFGGNGHDPVAPIAAPILTVEERDFAVANLQRASNSDRVPLKLLRSNEYFLRCDRCQALRARRNAQWREGTTGGRHTTLISVCIAGCIQHPDHGPLVDR